MPENRAKEDAVLWTILTMLLILWLFGLIGGYTFGGYIHWLLIIAAVLVVLNLLNRRRLV